MRIVIYCCLLLSLFLLVNFCNPVHIKNLIKKSPSSKDAGPILPKEIDGMVLVPGGWFEMGSNKKENERPIHRVYVDPFYMDKYEVTVEEFQQFCKATRRRMPHQPAWSRENHPVVNVTWEEARAYAQWKGKRLPTEVEWEFAARAGTRSLTYILQSEKVYIKTYGNVADISLMRQENRRAVMEQYEDGFPYTSPVGYFPPNPFGIFDLEGNVLEWCADWYDPYYYSKSPAQNPKGPETGRYKVIRGGSWNRKGAYLRTTFRTWYPPSVRFNFLGFRCVKSAAPSEPAPSLVQGKERHKD